MKSTFHLLLCSTILILASGCSTVKLQENATTSTVAISASSTSIGGHGSGITIEVLNVETGSKLRSQSFGKMSNHSVLQNLPAGKYLVTGIELPIGNLIFKRYDETVTEYFGPIEIESGERYYLGFYSGKQKIGLRNAVSLTRTSTQVPEKLLRKFSEADNSVANRDFAVLRVGHDSESLIIY